jgi:hypothetical protein
VLAQCTNVVIFAWQSSVKLDPFDLCRLLEHTEGLPFFMSVRGSVGAPMA